VTVVGAGVAAVVAVELDVGDGDGETDAGVGILHDARTKINTRNNHLRFIKPLTLFLYENDAIDQGKDEPGFQSRSATKRPRYPGTCLVAIKANEGQQIWLEATDCV
jgi:hypothetical protein